MPQSSTVALNFADVAVNGNLLNLVLHAGHQGFDAASLGALARLFSEANAGSGVAGAAPGDVLHARIKDAVGLSNAGSASASLELLERLRRDEWAGASPRNRCRMLAGIGFARLVLDDQAGAIHDFRAAYAEDPDRAGARGVLALARYLSGEIEAAFAAAKQALSDDPACEQAAVVLPLVAPAALTLPEVLALIPELLRGKPDVLISLVTAARDRGDRAAALRMAEDAHSRAPEDWRACSTFAEELLAPVFGDDAIAFTKAVPAGLTEGFHRGLDLLRRAWDRVKAGDHARRMGHIAANLASALAVAGEEDGAEQAIDEGLRLRPDNAVLLRRRAGALAVQNDWPGVRRALSSIPEAELEPDDRLLLGKAALAYGDAGGAREAAMETLESLPAGDRSRQGAAALALEAELVAGGGAAAITAAWDANPDSVIVRSAALEAARAHEALRDRLLADLTRIASSASDPRDRALAADALGALGEHSRAADLFATLVVPLDRDTLVLRGRLRALIMADRRREARELFEAIAVSLRVRQSYFEFGMTLYERIGLRSRALKLVEQHLEREPDDLRARLAWIDLCERTGRTEPALTWLAGVPATVAGTAHELMALAHAVDRHLADEKSLRIGYRALRQGYDDAKVHAGYTFGLYLFGRAAQGDRPAPTWGAPDTAVALKEVGGQGILVRVIETEPEPRIERGEIPSSDAFASRLIGLGVGDEIDVLMLGAQPKRFRVEQIQDKFLHAHFRSLAEFHELFPETLCCMGRGSGRTGLYPVPGSGDADGLRASQLQHTVEGVDADVHLGHAAPVRARMQPVADHPFVT